MANYPEKISAETFGVEYPPPEGSDFSCEVLWAIDGRKFRSLEKLTRTHHDPRLRSG